MSTKTIIASTLIAGGLIISGITFTGMTSISNIKESVENMKAELMEAMADNEYLRSQFTALETLYNDSVNEANGKINGLVTQRDDLLAQLKALNEQIEAEGGAKDEEAQAIQAEINRLEGELTKANEEVAALEVYVDQIEAESQYNAIDRSEYTITEVDVQAVSIVSVSDSAKSFNESMAMELASEYYVSGLETATGVNIIGVTTNKAYDGTTYFAYTVAEGTSKDKFPTTSPAIVKEIFTELGGRQYIYFLDPNGVQLGVYSTN